MTRLSLTSAIEAYERDLIQDALKTARGNRAKAAKLLDSTERIIGYKVKSMESVAVVFDRKPAWITSCSIHVSTAMSPVSALAYKVVVTPRVRPTTTIN